MSASFRPARLLLTLFILVVAVNGSDETGTGEVKCGACETPVPPSPPPPPPPSPPPPVVKPPPSPKKPPSSYCPPPPNSYIYIAGPPGDLYTTNPNFGAAGRTDVVGKLWVLVGCAAVGLLMMVA